MIGQKHFKAGLSKGLTREKKPWSFWFVGHSRREGCVWFGHVPHGRRCAKECDLMLWPNLDWPYVPRAASPIPYVPFEPRNARGFDHPVK